MQKESVSMDDLIAGIALGIGITLSFFGIAHGCRVHRDCGLCEAQDIRGGSRIDLWVCPACRSKVYGIYDNKGNNQQEELQK